MWLTFDWRSRINNILLWIYSKLYKSSKLIENSCLYRYSILSLSVSHASKAVIMAVWISPNPDSNPDSSQQSSLY